MGGTLWIQKWCLESPHICPKEQHPGTLFLAGNVPGIYWMWRRKGGSNPKMMKWFYIMKKVGFKPSWEFERFLLGIWWVSIFHPFPLGGFYPSGLASRNLYSSPKRCLLKLETWNDSRGPPRRLQWHRMGFFQQDLRMRPCAWHSHGSFLTPNLKKGAV
jgi:hypothetical protein